MGANIGIVIKDNIFCPYCRCDLRLTERTEEHVIGRRFVPKSSLDNQWNFKLDACVSCNRAKARLESGLSAMSLYAAAHDDDFAAEAKIDLIRKLGPARSGGATHPISGAPVVNSSVSEEVDSGPGPFRFKATLVAPPQDWASADLLAKLHIQALLYLVTNVNQTSVHESRAFTEQSQHLPRHYIHPLFAQMRSDWGNPQLIELIDRTRTWPGILLLETARGYFRASARHENTTPRAAVFWALEWNKSYRIAGMIRDPNQPHTVEKDLPPRSFSQFGPGIRLGFERPIKVGEADDLFSTDNFQ